MFLQEGPHGTSVLYIPSVFISYNGEALDEKTVLLRSSEVLAKNAIKVLDLIHDPKNGKCGDTSSPSPQ
jgi:glutamine synthetase